MLRNHSGFRFWPLRGDSGESPTFAFNTQLMFDLKNLPIATNRLANYVVGICLDFIGGVYNLGATAGGRISKNGLTRSLIDNVDLQGAWHGRPLAQQTVRGHTLPEIEIISCGYRRYSRPAAHFHNTVSTAQGFTHSVFLPLSHWPGEKGHHTAQLALWYKDAQLFVQTAPSTVLVGLGSASANFTTMPSVRASAVLLAEPELRMGPGVEWQEFRQAAQANNDIVDLDSLGNMTALDGVEPGAGIDAILAMSDNMGGSFDPATVSRLSVPFRDQTQTAHVAPFQHYATSQADMQQRDDLVLPAAAEVGSNGRIFAKATWPFDVDNGQVVQNDESSQLFGGLRFIPLVLPAREMETSKLQVIEGTQTYNITASFGGPTHRTLVHQYKSWTPAKLADAKQRIIDSGLANLVEQTTDLEWSVKATKKNSVTISGAKSRFLPLCLRRRVQG